MSRLSDNFILKFEPLSQTYVVVKNDKVKMQIDEQPRPATPPVITPAPQPPQSPEPVNPPTPAPSLPSGEDAVCLSATLYNSTRILSMLYQQMRNISRSNASQIAKLEQENALTQIPLLNIYFELSGESTRPVQNLKVPSLGNNFCSGLEVVSDYLQSMINTNLALQRAVNVQDITRQLLIIGTSFVSQKSEIDNMKNSC